MSQVEFFVCSPAYSHICVLGVEMSALWRLLSRLKHVRVHILVCWAKVVEELVAFVPVDSHSSYFFLFRYCVTVGRNID